MSVTLEEIRDVAPDLWLWRTGFSDWLPEIAAAVGWEPPLTSTCVESNGEVALLDPVAPPNDADAFWSRLDARPPTVLVVLKPDHVRDLDVFASRYPSVKAFGPRVFHRDDVPATDLMPIDPGTRLPGDLLALYDGRGRNETPLWLPEQRTLVFADALTERDGQLRIWRTSWHRERVVPALRTMLDLPFERVIVSHGEPVHDRGAFERALELPTWPESVS